MDAKECREAFEAWAKAQKQGFMLTHIVGGTYLDDPTQCAWLAWQAAWNRRADAQDAADAKRYRWIEDNCWTHGGGTGFTIFVPVDHEDIGCGIDAAIAGEGKA